MSQFCNQINVYRYSDVRKTTANKIIAKEGKKPHIIYTDDFFLDADIVRSSGLILNVINKKIYADKQTESIEKFFSNLRSVIIECITDKNKNIVIGSLKYPAKLCITPSTTSDIINLEWKTPDQIHM